MKNIIYFESLLSKLPYLEEPVHDFIQDIKSLSDFVKSCDCVRGE